MISLYFNLHSVVLDCGTKYSSGFTFGWLVMERYCLKSPTTFLGLHITSPSPFHRPWSSDYVLYLTSQGIAHSCRFPFTLPSERPRWSYIWFLPDPFFWEPCLNPGILSNCSIMVACSNADIPRLDLPKLRPDSRDSHQATPKLQSGNIFPLSQVEPRQLLFLSAQRAPFLHTYIRSWAFNGGVLQC